MEFDHLDEFSFNLQVHILCVCVYVSKMNYRQIFPIYTGNEITHVITNEQMKFYL